MGFRENMKVQTSNAEMLLAIMLEDRNITGWLTDERLCLESTVPDFYFPTHKLCVYLDGPPHKSCKRQDRDDKITSLLEQRGYKVLRYPYGKRITVSLLEEIFADIKNIVKLYP
ncbi:MAG: endonuclease domain-containing protein [Proteobacteria bacterium]|nr:endonuclease domain-containing protein [Pseudomonadota bacterium]